MWNTTTAISIAGDQSAGLTLTLLQESVSSLGWCPNPLRYRSLSVSPLMCRLICIDSFAKVFFNNYHSISFGFRAQLILSTTNSAEPSLVTTQTNSVVSRRSTKCQGTRWCNKTYVFLIKMDSFTFSHSLHVLENQVKFTINDKLHGLLS